MQPAFQDVVKAADRLREVAVDTPAIRSEALSRASGCEALLKLENLQRDGSFKLRGAYVALERLAPHRGAIAASGGNHALGVARAAALLRRPATIVVPEATPFAVIAQTQALGATVIRHGNSLPEATAEAKRRAACDGLAFVHAYDDPDIVAGAGTVGLELMRQCAAVEVVLVPVGGGGLIAGVALAVKHVRPETKVIAVQSAVYPTLRNALNGDAPPAGGTTFAEGIAVREIGTLNLAIARRLVDDVILVDECSIARAVYFMLEVERYVVEGAGAAAVAALMEYGPRFAGRSVAAIVTGSNLDIALLASLIAQARTRDGRIATLFISVPDEPGALARVYGILAERGANVIDVSHHRTFPEVRGNNLRLDVTIEARRSGDLLDILDALRSEGFKATLPDATP